MSDVKIRLLGSFEVTENGNLVLAKLRQARKTNLFIEYLILNKGKPVSHEELLAALWSERESANPATALRTLLHRYRSLIKESGITELDNSVLTTRGYYQWNTSLACEIDVYELERLYREAANGLLARPERIARCMRVLDLYIGPLLGGLEEAWIVQKRLYYRDCFKECILMLIEMLKQDESYETIVQVCRRAQEVEPLDERLHLEHVMALSKTGRKHEALSQYYFLNDIVGNDPGPEAAETLRDVYRRLVQADSAADADVDAVRSMLEAEDDNGGAMLCEYSIFSDIYRIQQRMLVRSDSTIFLALCTVGSTNGEAVDPLVQEHAMQDLLAVLRGNLRRGDTISRYSATQYVVLLPMVTYDAGKAVMDRVRQAFYQAHSKSCLMLNYKIRSLHSNGTFDPGGKQLKS